MKFSAEHLPFLLLLCGGLAFSIGKKKLSIAGAITGAICGTVIYLGSGYPGFLSMTAFFLLGTLATSIGRRQKEQVEKRGDTPRRNYKQVLANAGMGTLLALFALADPAHAQIYQILVVVSMASASADTLSSELGMVWGRQFFNCITWKKEARGLDGVISLQGTLAGICAAALIALLYAGFSGFSSSSSGVIIIISFSSFSFSGFSSGSSISFSSSFILITLCGAIGSHADSIIGATLERKNRLSNDAVNFLSTLLAVFSALLIILISQCAL